ncbi:MAG: glycoside hydrolase family 13 protein [Anaerolineales bacterium]
MTTPDWVQDAIFYQIFPDRFARSERMPDLGFEAWDAPPTHHGFKGGDLYGVIEKLDYLQNLGITAIYFNPIFASASNHRYHTFDYYQVDPLLGGNQALRLLLDEAHTRGMRVILDGVFNHASRGFWQFHHVLETGASSPYKTWFHFDEDRLLGRKPWGAYPTPEENEALKNGTDSLTAIGYKGWWNLPALPKFNTDTPAVREFLFNVAEYWIRFGIDGWRLDVPGEIDDDAFWQEFRQRVRAINPDAYIVGEIWHESQRWLAGDQFDAVMNYLVLAATLGFVSGSHLDMRVVNQVGGIRDRVRSFNAEEFANEIDHLTNLYRPEITRCQLNLLDSHDMPRFITCAGNDPASLKLAWLFIFSYIGPPCIYYGDEIGLTGEHDPDCRKAFNWDRASWNMDLFNYVRKLIALRKTYPSLRRGSFSRLYATDGVYASGRRQKDETIVTALNVSETARNVEIQVSELKQESAPAEIIFGENGNKVQRSGDKLYLEIPPRSGLMIKL